MFESHSADLLKHHSLGNSLAVWRVGLTASPAMAQVHFLVRELRTHKSHGVTKTTNNLIIRLQNASCLPHFPSKSAGLQFRNSNCSWKTSKALTFFKKESLGKHRTARKTKPVGQRNREASGVYRYNKDEILTQRNLKLHTKSLLAKLLSPNTLCLIFNNNLQVFCKTREKSIRRQEKYKISFIYDIYFGITGEKTEDNDD